MIPQSIRSMLPESPVFTYRTLRFLVGIIALILPFLVVRLSREPLTSISASYFHDDARDWFVGLLFVVAAFLLGYNGTFYRVLQASVARLAAACAAAVAIFPTSPDGGEAATATIHGWAAAVLFLCLAFFCTMFAYGAYLKSSKRLIVYLLCAGGILVGLALGAYAWSMNADQRAGSHIVYWAEWIALISFGIAWLWAGSYKWVLERLQNLGVVGTTHLELQRSPWRA